MKKSFVATIMSLLVSMTSGCAYLTTYTKSLDLGSNSYSMDVKQRVVFSQALPGPVAGTSYRVVCAEPSPDALAVISASAGLGAAHAITGNAATETSTGAVRNTSNISGSTNTSANVSAALAETGAFVGLRTQSIQLLRDAMYRLCEGYASGAISGSEFTSMQRRYQSTMMGLLAIEQLTRPVVATQVVLASSANAQAGGSAGDAAVDKAQERVDTTNQAHLQTMADLDAAKTRESSATKTVNENRAALNAEKAKAKKENREPDVAITKPLEEAYPGLQEEQTKARDAVRDATRRADAAAGSKRDAETALRDAKAKVTAAASGSGQFGAHREASAQITAELTKGVTEIVQEINKSYTRDGCFALIAELISKPERVALFQAAPNEKAGDPVIVLRTALGMCQQILDTERVRLESTSTLNRGAPGR